MSKKTLIVDNALDLRDNKISEEVIEEKNELIEHGFSEAIGLSAHNKNDKWFGYGKFFIYLLIFLTPLFFLPITVVPVEMNKIFLSLVLIIASFICYLVNILSTRKIVYPGSKIVLAVFGFIAAIFLSYFFSQDKSISFYGDLTQADSLLSLLISVLAFYLASVFFKRRDFKKIGIIFLASLGLASAIGALQLAQIYIFPFDFTRQAIFNTVGTFFNYAVFIAFGLIIIVAALSELKLSLAARRILLAFSLFLAAQLAVFNFQVLWLEIAIVILLAIAYKFAFTPDNLSGKNNFEAGKEKTGGVGIPIVFMIFAFLFFLIGPSLPQIVKLPVRIKPSLSSTLTVAKEVLKGKQILFGSGPSTFAYNFTLFRPIELNQTDFWSVKFSQGFSFLATSLATTGIIGVLAFFALIVSFVFLTLKNIKNDKLLVIALGLLFLSIELFINEAYFAQLVFIFAGFGFMAALAGEQKEISLESLPKTGLLAGFLVIIVLITSALAMFYYTGRKYAAAVYYGQAMIGGDFNKSLDTLNKALMMDSESGQYLRDLSQFILLDINSRKEKQKNSSEVSAEIDKAIQNEVALAVQLAQKAAIINPNDSLNWINLADIYEKITGLAGGADLFAEKNYQEAIMRDPKNPYLRVSAARVLIASGDLLKAQSIKEKDTQNEQKKKLEEAMAYLEKAIELKSDYAPAYFQIAMVYARQGKTNETIGQLEKTRQYAPFDSNLAFQLGSLYFYNNRIDDAQAELERAISLDDKYSDALYILGLIYDKNGKKGRAIDQFKKILSLNPENETVKKILKNLSEDKEALQGIENSSEIKDEAPDSKARTAE